jgi:signal transduction histidine kinase
MDKIPASEPGTKQQPITLLIPASQMEVVPLSNELSNPLDLEPGAYEKEYIDFIDLAAHELDAPLRKLSLLTERLTEKLELASQNKDVHAYIERINSCVSDMRSAVDSISVLAKTASEKRPTKTVNLEEVIQQVVESLIVPVRSANATIRISGLPTVQGDAGQFLLLFKNLIENAIKFAKENVAPEIQIGSSVAAGDELLQFGLPVDRGYHRIEIADNGIGFKKDYAEKIFRPFVRLHGKSRFVGNGVGLAICKKVVENYHGIIYADSGENEGSRFIILLPQTL